MGQTTKRRDSTIESGQAVVEYAFILALVTAVAYAALGSIGPQVASIFTAVENSFPG